MQVINREKYPMAKPKRGEGTQAQKRVQQINQGGGQEKKGKRETVQEKREAVQNSINDYYNKILKNRVDEGDMSTAERRNFAKQAEGIRDKVLEQINESEDVDLNDPKYMYPLIEKVFQTFNPEQDSKQERQAEEALSGFSFKEFDSEHIRPREGQEKPSEAERFIEQTIPAALLKDLSESDRTSLAQEISGRLEAAAKGIEDGPTSANEQVKAVRDLALEKMLKKIDDKNVTSQIETMIGHDEEEEAETEAGLELVEGMENEEIAQEFLENVASAQGIDADITPDLADHFISSYSVQANSALERLKTGLSEDNEKMQDKATQQIKNLAESYFKQKYDQFDKAA
jgi:hypothetical protein